MNLIKNNRNLKQVGISAAALLMAVGISAILIKTRPEPKKEGGRQELPLVETMSVERVNAPVIVVAQGQMEPAVSLRLVAEVSGRIKETHKSFAKGGVIKKGEVLVRIDPKEYELAVRQKKSLLASAKLNLAVEEAQREVAKDEYARRNQVKASGSAKALATRALYLDKAKGEYESALAEVERAELNLQKTIIRAPINAMIASTGVTLGEFAFAQALVANIYGTDEFRAEVSIPVAELAHIDFADLGHGRGSSATISQLSMGDAVIKRQGVVTKLLPDLGQLGHMAKVVVSVKNPMMIDENGFDELPLLAGAKVSVEITGRELKNVFAIPRSAFVSDDEIMVVDENSVIRRIKPKIVRRDRDVIYAVGADIKGQNIVITNNASTAVGQKVRLAAAQE